MAEDLEMTSVVGSFEEIRLSIALRRTGGTSAAGLCSNASRLRTFWFDALRLAGRVALTQLRSVVKPCRAIPTAFRTDCLNVIQRLPSAVCVVAYPEPLSVSVGHCQLRPAVESHLTARGEAGVPQVLGGSRGSAGL